MPLPILPTHLDTVFAVALGFLASTMGVTLGQAAPVPDWAQPVMGPLGALVLAAVAVWWQTKKLDRVEREAIIRQAEYQKALLDILRTQVEAVTQNTRAWEENRELLERVANCMAEVEELLRVIRKP